MIHDVRNGAGHQIDSQDQVGGWPQYESAPPPPDTDNDGIPDDWEREHHLNPSDNADGVKPADDGHTKVERYLNDLIHAPNR
jgi:hypothetical protein